MSELIEKIPTIGITIAIAIFLILAFGPVMTADVKDECDE